MTAVAGQIVSRETERRLREFAARVVAENRNQNLISRSSEQSIWARHVEDSAQLLRLAPDGPSGRWLDVGTGPGFPGLVIALIRNRPITLVEERARRVAFLKREVEHFTLGHVTVVGEKLERVASFHASVITARAFAPLPKLLSLAERFSRPATRWILPKGRSAAEELESVRDAWHGDFTIEPSLTDPTCGIIVATDVRRRG